MDARVIQSGDPYSPEYDTSA